MTSVSKKPWLSVAVPRELDIPKGWLGPEERRMLFWTTNHHFCGVGSVVDAGAYAGASAFCLAAGLAASRLADSALARVHSYDWFVANDEYVAAQLTMDFLPTAVGASFRDIFEYQTGKYRDRIDIHEGDFLALNPPASPVEILFIDVAKTAQINAKVLLEYFPKLVPGISLVIHQDFYQAWHPYIHVSMALLAEYFELLDPLVEFQSRIWRLRKPIPASVLADVAHNSCSVEQVTRLIDRAIEAETAPDVAKAMKAAKLLCLFQAGHIDEARAYDLTLPKTLDASGALWETQLAQVREWFQA